ncbi:DUF2325 domain-containing protein [Exiguobacterium acetylicum]|uniref:DUF2325 domain-containing protein n=1 Tax=Exiguobacterium acetylicum TaxID=41170 RepID=UPI003977C5D2
MMQQVLERATELVQMKLAVVERYEDWQLWLDEVNGIDEWVKMSAYYAPRDVQETPVIDEVLELEKQTSVMPQQVPVEPVRKQRYAYTFQRGLKGGTLLEWSGSYISERDVREWNLEHGMEVRVRVERQDDQKTMCRVEAVVSTERMRENPERVVFEQAIVKAHGIVEETVNGPLQDEAGKSFYYVVPVEDMRYFRLEAGQLVDLVMWRGRKESLTIVWKHQFTYEKPVVNEPSDRPVKEEQLVEKAPVTAKKSDRYARKMKRQTVPKPKKAQRRIRIQKERKIEPIVTTAVPGQLMDFVDKTPLDFTRFKGMRLVIVGNEQQTAVYREFFAPTGIELIHLAGDAQSAKKIACLAKKTDAIVVVTSRVSHAASAHVIAQAKKHGIPFAMERLDGRRSLYTACERQLERAWLKEQQDGKLLKKE